MFELTHRETLDDSTLHDTNNHSDATQTIVTDGGEEIRDLHEIRHSDDEVRHYHADGTLFAYREADEHIIVSQGKEPATKWAKHVPAERTAVAPGEHLWTIPDNWEHYCSIRDTDIRTVAVYSIPENNVDVLVSVPKNNHLIDAWYGVKRVGQFTVKYADEINWSDLSAFLEEFESRDEIDDAVLDALGSLYRRRRGFENSFERGVNDVALDVFERRYGLDEFPATLEDWVVEPWGDHAFQFDDLLRDTLEQHSDVEDDTLEELRRLSVIPRYPEVSVDVEAGAGLPEGYHMRALTQAGCTPPEALDYRMVEQLGMSQSAWASEREISQPSVSNNVNQAQQILIN